MKGRHMDNSDFVSTEDDRGMPLIFRKSRIKSSRIRTDGYVEVEYETGITFKAKATKDWPKTGRRTKK